MSNPLLQMAQKHAREAIFKYSTELVCWRRPTTSSEYRITNIEELEKNEQLNDYLTVIKFQQPPYFSVQQIWQSGLCQGCTVVQSELRKKGLMIDESFDW